MTHVERIRAAALALDAHSDAVRDFSGSADEKVIDLLTNILHYAAFKGLDTEGLVQMAVQNFTSETAENP